MGQENKVNGATVVCGIIGSPIEHTKSPLIHNTLARRLQHNLIYVPLPVDREHLEEAIKGAYALHMQGLNVTIPFKSKVISYLAEMDPAAEKIGAVNTLVRGENGYKGYNTDMMGLYRALCSEGIVLTKERVIVLGAGGAARAAAFLCAEKEAKQVYLLNRTIEKAASLAREVNQAYGRELVIPLLLTDYQRLPADKFLAIQATGVGLYPDTDRAVIEDKEFYDQIHTGYDLIYSPRETRFMTYVKKAGGQAYNGLKMLLYQAVMAYELWNQVHVTEKEAASLYEFVEKQV